jgi:hypothetical protein
MTTFEDWHAIHRLVMTYGEHIDSARFSEAAAMFENATYRIEHLSAEFKGATEVQDFLAARRMFPDGTPRTKHVFTNVIIEIDGETASARYYATVLQQTDILPLQPIAAGCYIDTFERVGGQWRLADRLLTGFLLGDRSQHVPWSEGPPGDRHS